MSSRPSFYLMDDFLSEDFRRPDFIIDRLIPFGGEPCIIFGDPGHGKSFLCNTIIKAVADGEPLLKQFRTMQARVVYCSFDMPVQLVQKRIRALRRLVENPDNVGIVVSDKRINIMKAKETDDWLARTLDHEPALVVLDTLRKIHYMDESEQKTVTAVYGKLGDLFSPRTTPLLVAHQRKYGALDAVSARADQRMSGHYSWISDSDFGVQVTKDERHNPVKATLRFARLRHTDKIEPIETQFDSETDTLKILVTPLLRARELLMEHPTMPEHDLAAILMDENLCQRSRAYKVAKHVLDEVDGK